MSFRDFIYESYEVLETNRDNEIRISCPFCDDDKFHGYINTKKNVFYCQKCHASPKSTTRGYTAFHFLRTAHQLTSQQAISVVRGKDPISQLHSLTRTDTIEDAIARLRADDEVEEDKEEVVEMPQSVEVRADDNTPFGSRAYKYIHRRLGDRASEMCSRFNFRYCMTGEYKGRIILPVYSPDNKLVFFQARAFLPTDLKPKYKNPHVSAHLFNPTFPRKDWVILCEGYFDALAIGWGGVSCLGSRMTDLQFHQLLELNPKYITVCFDEDEAGIVGALETCRRLRPCVEEVSVVTNMGGKDPCDMGSGAAEFIRLNASPFDINTEILLEMYGV